MCKCADEGILLALERRRYGFLQAEEEKRPRFPPPDAVLQPESCDVEDKRRHCYCYYLCLKRKDWSFFFLNKTNNDHAVLGRRLFWREDFWVRILSREQCLHAAPGEALQFRREEASVSAVWLKALQFPRLDFALAARFLKCEMLHHLTSDTLVILHVPGLYYFLEMKKMPKFSVVIYQTNKAKQPG